MWPTLRSTGAWIPRRPLRTFHVPSVRGDPSLSLTFPVPRSRTRKPSRGSQSVWSIYNSEDRDRAVGQERPNLWGFFDMHGNVYEWCHDWYGDYESGIRLDQRSANNGWSGEGVMFPRAAVAGQRVAGRDRRRPTLTHWDFAGPLARQTKAKRVMPNKELNLLKTVLDDERRHWQKQ